jgi:hypothetical protein
MKYTTVFDIAQAGYKEWSFPAFGLIFVAVAIAMLLFRGKLSGITGKRSQYGRGAAWLLLSIAGLWTIGSFVATFGEYRTLLSSLKDGRARVVEGIVTEFTPMPSSGHALERFCVSHKCFHYSDFEVSAGFNNTSSHGGPIREGLPVRVTYVDDTIVRLEVAR